MIGLLAGAVAVGPLADAVAVGLVADAVVVGLLAGAVVVGGSPAGAWVIAVEGESGLITSAVGGELVADAVAGSRSRARAG